MPKRIKWVCPKIMVPPNHPMFNRGFSTINHPFWGKTPYFWKHPNSSNKLLAHVCTCYVSTNSSLNELPRPNVPSWSVESHSYHVSLGCQTSCTIDVYNPGASLRCVTCYPPQIPHQIITARLSDIWLGSSKLRIKVQWKIWWTSFWRLNLHPRKLR